MHTKLESIIPLPLLHFALRMIIEKVKTMSQNNYWESKSKNVAEKKYLESKSEKTMIESVRSEKYERE